MRDAPCFPFFWRDWRSSSSVRLMSPAARGAYVDLLCAQWERGALPPDPVDLRRLADVPARLWPDVWGQLAEHFVEVDGGVIIANPIGLRATRPRPTWSTAAYPAVFERDGDACRYCGAPGADTVDHVTPRIQGGSDDADNLVVCCRRCNGRKGGRTPAEAGLTLLAAPGCS